MIRRRVRINLSDLNGGFDSDPCSFQHSSRSRLMEQAAPTPSVIEFDTTSSALPPCHACKFRKPWQANVKQLAKDLHRYSKVENEMFS